MLPITGMIFWNCNFQCKNTALPIPLTPSKWMWLEVPQVRVQPSTLSPPPFPHTTSSIHWQSCRKRATACPQALGKHIPNHPFPPSTSASPHYLKYTLIWAHLYRHTSLFWFTLIEIVKCTHFTLQQKFRLIVTQCWNIWQMSLRGYGWGQSRV